MIEPEHASGTGNPIAVRVARQGGFVALGDVSIRRVLGSRAAVVRLGKDIHHVLDASSA